MLNIDEESAKAVETPAGIGIPIEEYEGYIGKDFEGNMCSNDWNGWTCTLEDGHEGPHVAHVCSTWIAAVWPQE